MVYLFYFQPFDYPTELSNPSTRNTSQMRRTGSPVMRYDIAGQFQGFRGRFTLEPSSSNQGKSLRGEQHPYLPRSQV